MRHISDKGSIRTAVMLTAAGIGIAFAPDDATDRVRIIAYDVLQPGQQVARSTVNWLRLKSSLYIEAIEQAQAQEEYNDQLEETQLALRRLQIKNATLHEVLQNPVGDRHWAPGSIAPSPLAVPDMLHANLIGEESAELWRAGLIVDVGSNSQLVESSYVLEDPLPLIDRGHDVGLSEGLPAYAGRVVVGKVARVGHWSSTIQPVTHQEFSALAQLARAGSQGVHYGAKGILEGTGSKTCRMRFVESTFAVSVGDLVVSGGRDGLFPFPVFFGTVVKADLGSDAPHWEIEVAPAANLSELKSVHILRKSFNRGRLLAH